MSLLNFLHNTNNIVSNQQNYSTDYPEVFYTKDYKQNIQQHTVHNFPQQRGKTGILGLSKDMISQFLPLLFGKGDNSNNILASLMQSGFIGENKNLSEIFSVLSHQNKSNTKNSENNKKDMPSIIDMSDYKEIN